MLHGFFLPALDWQHLLCGVLTVLAVPEGGSITCEALCVCACWVIGCQMQRAPFPRTHLSTQHINNSIVLSQFCR